MEGVYRMTRAISRLWIPALMFIVILCLADKSSEARRILPESGGTVTISFIKQCEVQQPLTHKGVTLFPVYGPGEMRIANILTLDEAIRSGELQITELPQESVNELSVQNNSKRWVYIMAGEILKGSKQDRVLKDDVLLPPESGKIRVAVYCVEHGRWTYTSREFGSGRNISNISVRQTAKERKDQSAVWTAIAKTQRSLRFEAPTGALNETYSAPRVKEEIDDSYEHFRNLPQRYPRMNGVVVGIGRKILCADLFADRDIFIELWPKLLKSYLLEASSRGSSRANIHLDDARAFLRFAADSSCHIMSTPGEGTLVELSSSRVSGSALVYKNDVLHIDIFPRLSSSTSPKVWEEQQPPIQRRYR